MSLNHSADRSCRFPLSTRDLRLVRPGKWICCCVVLLLCLATGAPVSAEDPALTPEEFLKRYRAAVKQQLAQLVDFEMDLTEQLPRRGNYQRTIFVRAPQHQDPLAASRGDILTALDEQPSQNIFTRVHFCHADEVTVLLRRDSSTDPFEIYLHAPLDPESIQFALSSNVDAYAYASFAWFSQPWLDYFEQPGAIIDIQRTTEAGVPLVEVSFQLPEDALINGQKPNFDEATVSLEPGRDWIFRKVRTPEGGVAASHDSTLRIFYEGRIDKYEQHGGMWLPAVFRIQHLTRDQDGKRVREEIQTAELTAVRTGPIPDSRFELQTYGLGTISAAPDAAPSGTAKQSQRRVLVLVLNLLIAGVLLVIFMQRRRSKRSRQQNPDFETDVSAS